MSIERFASPINTPYVTAGIIITSDWVPVLVVQLFDPPVPERQLPHPVHATTAAGTSTTGTASQTTATPQTSRGRWIGDRRAPTAGTHQMVVWLLLLVLVRLLLVLLELVVVLLRVLLLLVVLQVLLVVVARIATGAVEVVLVDEVVLMVLGAGRGRGKPVGSKVVARQILAIVIGRGVVDVLCLIPAPTLLQSTTRLRSK